jgi:hydroxymethylglutaryl-CoA reductase
VKKSSRLKGFHRLDPSARLEVLSAHCALEEQDRKVLSRSCALEIDAADKMIENAVGVLPLPLGVGVNLRVNDIDRLVMMALEEPSVIAGLSNAAKKLRKGGGVAVEVSEPLMIAQIQLLDVADLDAAEERIMAAKNEILERANEVDAPLVAAGGGARDLELRRLIPAGPDDPVGAMLIVHLVVDVRDAMGANAVNTMAERLAKRISELAGGRVRLRILSNLADRRLVTARGRVPFDALGSHGQSGEQVAQGIVEASAFAERDPYRAATHNKGIMNGIDALLLAAGQDFRAVEAGAHAYAARNGRYSALSRWRTKDASLVGELTMPMAVGTVGGVVRVHPTVKVALKVMKISTAADLAGLAVGVGLAQNLGALRALAVEGIQKGHMRLHARNLAMSMGATAEEVGAVVDWMTEHNKVNSAGAEAALEAVGRHHPEPQDTSDTNDPIT